MSRLGELSGFLIPALWAIWIVSWTLAAVGVKRTRWRESRSAAVYNRLPVLLGILMLLVPRPLPAVLTQRLIPPELGLSAIGTLLVLLGLLFAFWARWHLGRNWSGMVTIKEQHTLITSGPYRLVRHPIYTGILFALIGTALAIGALYGFVATGLVLIGFIIKVEAEEEAMRQTFPADYGDYSQRTARLIPGVY